MATVLEPTGTAATHQSAALVEEEARLAHAAADGDGGAFATLYERYERRAYNLAYRVTGSEHDAADAVQEAFLSVMRRLPKLAGRELAFGSYLFTATRNACYDLMQKRRRSEPSDSIPESAAPIGAGAGGLGLDPGDPEDDPDRSLLLESQQEEIREASSRLPERQREALALCELEELSYDEIAEIMEMNRNSVAQLISRARIKLRDELRGTALASIAGSSPDCERALPLIAMRDDGQLDEASDEAGWLDAHVRDCHTCTLGLEAMQEAGASYRAWTPVAAAPWLFEETMAKAAELVGADWSQEIAEHGAKRPAIESLPGIPPAYLRGVGEAGARKRRGALAAIGLAAVLLVAILATALGDDKPSTGDTAEPVLAPLEVEAAEPVESPKLKRKARKPRSEPQASPATPAPVTPAAPAPVASPTPESAPDEPERRRPKAPAEDPVEPEPDPETPVSEEPPVTDPPVTEPPATEPPPPPPPDDPPVGSAPPTGPRID